MDPLTPDRARAEAAQAAAREGVTRAIVLLPIVSGQDAEGARSGRTPEGRLAEAVGLAEAIALDVAASFVVPVRQPRPATLFGPGRVEDLKAAVITHGAALVIVDHPLTPVQQRNLEKELGAKVLDRTALILEIFGERAHTREGSLQVELAHLSWQKSRLVRSWTHLERQRGGFGFLGGPGETQIEADRRVIQDRITRVERELEEVRRMRALHRKQRRRRGQPVVALVGYTNAGKSTLFNALSSADVMAENLLFATLDPTVRRLELPHGQEFLLSDTVGFISNLPTHLIAAFRATLEELTEADLILHVRDIAHPETEAQARDVGETLQAIGVDPNEPGLLLEVWNKIDLLDPERRALLERNAGDSAIAISARTGEGLDRLVDAIERRLAAGRNVLTIEIPPEDGAFLAWLYRQTEVLEREDLESGLVRLTVRVPEPVLDEVRARADELAARAEEASPGAAP